MIALEPRAAPSHSDVKTGSDRAFGLLFAAIFTLVSLWPLLSAGVIRLWAVGVAALFLVPALVAPRLLAPLNLLWTRFGLLLGRIMSPVVLGLLFFLVFLPVGLVMRLLGGGVTRGRDRHATTYWISREPPGPAPGSMSFPF